MSNSTPFKGCTFTRISGSASVVHPVSYGVATTTAASSHCKGNGHIVRLIVTDTTSAGSGTVAWFEADGSTTLLNTFNNLSGGDEIEMTMDIENGFSFQCGGGADVIVVYAVFS